MNWLVGAMFLCGATAISAVYLLIKTRSLLLSARASVDHLMTTYGSLIDVDAYKKKSVDEREAVQQHLLELRNDYRSKREVFERLIKECAIYDNDIEIAEWGFYKPQFDFDVSEKFKIALEHNRQKQKILLDKELANMKSNGRSTKDMKLPDYAFNRACDAAISNVRWDNVIRMEQRIIKAFEFINRHGAGIYITQDVLDLKIEELRLTHEYTLKKKEEKDEQAAIRQQMREDAKLEDDVKKAVSDEDRFKKLFERAKKEAERSSGAKEKELEAKVEMLAGELLAAQMKTQRAKSLAEQTKRGHIYIISNKGSFGENVFKIGMTRRADPQDRVDELGDASVPFTFDVHAIIYTEDAPSLEKDLHRELADHRVNLVNRRKEFFRVELGVIQSLVHKSNGAAEFIVTAEAREYQESLALRASLEKKRTEGDARYKFPTAV